MIIVRIVQFVKIVQLVQLDYYGYIKFFGVFVGTWVGAFTNEEEIDVYVEKIRENKQQYQNDFYFGAYRIRNNEVELIKNSIKEIYRFCVKNK